MSLKSALRRLEEAKQNDNTLEVSTKELETHKGFTTEDMLNAGLRPYDLKVLEAHGYMKSGYAAMKNKLTGHRLTQKRWVIVSKSPMQELSESLNKERELVGDQFDMKDLEK